MDLKSLLTIDATTPRSINNTKVSNPLPTPTATLGPGVKNENDDHPQPPYP